MNHLTRREFVTKSALALSALKAMQPGAALAQIPGDRPPHAPEGVTILNPLHRVPVSMIIDDSTCLVNLAHFCIPQFHEVFPDRYLQPWKTLPREIPTAFVRKFGEWSQEHGVKGKYSVIPFPACVGWIDRDIPGWSKKELDENLETVRTVMRPNWDFHPEMVTHTWVIDTKTGRPFPERSERFMENWGWTDGKSADEIAGYMSYALRILKNVGLNCEGITTPGGFGNRVLPELAQATLQSCREVFGAEVAHYFRHIFTDERSVAPRVEYASGLAGSDPKCVVSMIGCTGDWFGGWDGLTPGTVDQFVSEDFRRGRMAEVIKRGEPAIMVGHWPGIYFNGQETGFNILKEVTRRLHAGFDNLIWMKLSEIARYWAAKELTRIERNGDQLIFRAPFATPNFSIRIGARNQPAPRFSAGNEIKPLNEVSKPGNLKSGSWTRAGQEIIACFDLPKGNSELQL